MVFNVVPTLKVWGPFIKNKGAWIHVGTDEERKGYTIAMNNLLREYCEERDYIFVDVYDAYCTEEGYLNKEMSDHSVHIKNPQPVIDFLKKNVLNMD